MRHLATGGAHGRLGWRYQLGCQVFFSKKDAIPDVDVEGDRVKDSRHTKLKDASVSVCGILNHTQNISPTTMTEIVDSTKSNPSKPTLFFLGPIGTYTHQVRPFLELPYSLDLTMHPGRLRLVPDRRQI